MNNEIILRSVYGKVGQTYFINPCPNPRTGRLPECVRAVRGPVDNTEMILSEDDIVQMNNRQKHFVAADHVFSIVDGTKFDLDDIIDAANWAAIEHCTWIAKDRDEKNAKGELVIDGNAKRYGVADLYVERPGEMTKIKMSKKQLIFKASSYVYEEAIEEQIKKCRVLGRNLSKAMPADVTDYLIDMAEKKPRKIISLYEEEGWKMQLFILDAIDRGVIRKSDNIYKYDDKMLGGSLEATVTLLSDPRFRSMTESIKRETYPNLLPKDQLAEITSTLTKGIPRMDDSVLDKTRPLTAKEKAEKLKKK